MQHHPLTGPANTVAAAKLSEKQAPTGKPMLVRHAIDSQAVLASVAADNAGASVLFVGTTRGLTSGVVTLSLEYEAHEMMASDCLAKLQAEALTRFELLGCAIVHRLGAVAVGAISVAIATSAPHRRNALRAAEWLMDRIKQEVPIWKCERGADGVRLWVHPASMPQSCLTMTASGGEHEQYR